ncbi:MAG TPA: hypothetical protein VF476_16200 [Chitinophagaceae bacterium]
MKQSVLNRTKALITLGLSAGLIIGNPVFAGSNSIPGIENPKDPGEKATAKKTKSKTVATSRNNDVVKIYPDIFKRSMHVIAKENDGKEIDFFVFDLDGTLLKNFKMKEKDHQLLEGLTKGRYQFRVFCGDDETANGQFEIR